MAIDPGTAMLFGSLLGFGSNFIGGGQSDTAINDQRWMNDFAWKQSLRNEQFQMDLANHGIRMRVDDAERSGLHPLVGAGINPASGGWSGAAFNSPDSNRPNRWGNAMSGLGQDISRASMARATEQERSLNEAQRVKLLAEADQASSAADLNRRSGLPPPTPSMVDKYMPYRLPDGSIEWVYNPMYAMGLGADPIRTWRNSAQNIFGNPDVMGLNSLQIQNTGHRSSGSYGRSSYGQRR